MKKEGHEARRAARVGLRGVVGGSRGVRVLLGVSGANDVEAGR